MKNPFYWHPFLEHYLVCSSANDNDDRELWEEWEEETIEDYLDNNYGDRTHED